MISLGSYPSSNEAHDIYKQVTNFIIDKQRTKLEIKEFAKKINPNIVISSKSGISGVYLYGNKFKSGITINGKFINLGYFDSIQEAEKAYLIAKKDKNNVVNKTRIPAGYVFSGNRYSVYVSKNGKKTSIGTYETKEEAKKIYLLSKELIKDKSVQEIKKEIKKINPRIKLEDNKHGFKGVNFHKPTKKYYSRIQINGKRIALGLCHTPEEAHEAYLKAKKELNNE